MRRLLHPGQVRKRAVVQRRAGADDQLEGLIGRGLEAGQVSGAAAGANRAEAGACDKAIVDGCAERRLEVTAETSSKLATEQVVAGVVATRRQRVQDLEVGMRGVVERLDQRLNDGDRAVVGAGVAPALEVVGGRNVPRAPLRRLVTVQAVVDRYAVGDPSAQRGLELEVGGQRVDRVGAEAQQHVDVASPMSRTSDASCGPTGSTGPSPVARYCTTPPPNCPLRAAASA